MLSNDISNWDFELDGCKELFKGIKIIENFIKSQFLMHDIWYNKYDNNNSYIFRRKQYIYEKVIDILIDKKQSEISLEDVDLAIKSLELVFNFMDTKVVENKLIDPENNNETETFNYDLETLKYNPILARELLHYHQLSLAC